MSYSNCYFLATKLPNISLLIKYMANNSIFQKKFGYYKA